MSLRGSGKCAQKLQTALHAKAKEMPTYRFYALYDKLYREDVLAHAWRLAEANGGAAAWMDNLSRTSRSMASSGGWVNWRKTLGRGRLHGKVVPVFRNDLRRASATRLVGLTVLPVGVFPNVALRAPVRPCSCLLPSTLVRDEG